MSNIIFLALFIASIQLASNKKIYLHNINIINKNSTSGKCEDFLRINNIELYCPGRNDDCYMNNFESRCYCDSFCSFDCCTDYKNSKKQNEIEISTMQAANTITNLTEKTKLFIEPENDDNSENHSCLKNPCQNGGICVTQDNSKYYCICMTKYSGKNCEKKNRVSVKENNKIDNAKEDFTTAYKKESNQKYLHGNNTIGKCSDFLNLNNLTECCSYRDDECYMNHYDSRCYCDIFCKGLNHYDCCFDAIDQCGIELDKSLVSTTTIPSYHIDSESKKCLEKETYNENCNQCICKNGDFICTKYDCMFNQTLLDSINNSKMNWQAETYSEFIYKTLNYAYLHKLGTILENPNLNAMTFDESDIEYDSYDFRKDKSSVKKLHITNQGDCGASWAYSTIDVALDRAINSPLIKIPYLENASVNNLIVCATKSLECRGDKVSRAWSYLNLFGVTNEKCLPLQKTNNNSIAKYLETYCYPHTGCITEGINHYPVLKSGPGYIINSIKISNIMNEIKNHGPVQMVFKVFNDFFMYKSGIYTKHPEAKILNSLNPYHSVKVLGWGSEIIDGKKIKYWIAANSWGSQWGENGYFRINREDKSTEIGKHVYAAWGHYIIY